MPRWVALLVAFEAGVLVGMTILAAVAAARERE